MRLPGAPWEDDGGKGRGGRGWWRGKGMGKREVLGRGDGVEGCAGRGKGKGGRGEGDAAGRGGAGDGGGGEGGAGEGMGGRECEGSES